MRGISNMSSDEYMVKVRGRHTEKSCPDIILAADNFGLMPRVLTIERSTSLPVVCTTCRSSYKNLGSIIGCLGICSAC